MQEQVYETKVRNTEELPQCIQTVCNEVDQHVINKAVHEWCFRLWVCVKRQIVTMLTFKCLRHPAVTV